jgi:hypothetical protein
MIEDCSVEKEQTGTTDTVTLWNSAIGQICGCESEKWYRSTIDAGGKCTNMIIRISNFESRRTQFSRMEGQGGVKAKRYYARLKMSNQKSTSKN